MTCGILLEAKIFPATHLTKVQVPDKPLGDVFYPWSKV